MPTSRLAALALLLASCTTTSQNSPQAAHGVEYRGGQWFDGTRFVDQTMYVADGVFHTRAPARIDSVVNLAGGYVIPPFGDAHQHLVDPRLEPTIRAHLLAGVFYVKDQANGPIMRPMLDAQLNKPTSIDYISAFQGWTGPGGHPVEVIKRGAAMGGPIAAFIRDSLDPGLVMQVANTADIDKRWTYFLAGRPHFVKVYLYHSEDHERLRNDPKAEGNRGMDPRLVPEIVKRAQAAGLHVSAHVYTAADFRNAVNGGVHQIAHLPGGYGPDSLFLITDADAAAAARKGVTVITTVTQHRDNALTARLLRTQYAHNINLLRKHRVTLLIGSDLFPGTAATEVDALVGSGLFGNLELLRMWSVTTPRAIFPARRIGALENGYEASFLVLRTDPLKDFRATQAIAMRVKQGVLLALAP
jgi:hypothetical protein